MTSDGGDTCSILDCKLTILASCQITCLHYIWKYVSELRSLSTQTSYYVPRTNCLGQPCEMNSCLSRFQTGGDQIYLPW